MTARRPSPGAPRRRGGATAVPSKPRPEGARLQKVIADAGVASRRAAEALIRGGRVRVDGRVVTELGTRVDPDQARIEVDGHAVRAQAKIVVVMNKPDEMVCSAEPQTDPRGRPTVVSLLGRLGARLFPIGRLDYHTRGVLLLTNDGELAAALAHPRRGVPKTYHAKFQGRLGEDELAQLHAGVQLEDGTRTRPALEVETVKATTTNTWVQITISQGLNRQIRRMGEAIGHSVLKLIRVAYGGITADGLREGQWRVLQPDEIATLRAAAGLTKKGRLAQADRAAARELLEADRPRRSAPAGAGAGKRPQATQPRPQAAAPARPQPRRDATAVSRPGASKPGASRSGAGNPGRSRPGASRPGASEPGASRPGASEPGARRPGASEPGASRSGAGKSGARSGAGKRGADRARAGKPREASAGAGERGRSRGAGARSAAAARAGGKPSSKPGERPQATPEAGRGAPSTGKPARPAGRRGEVPGRGANVRGGSAARLASRRGRG